MSRNIIKSLILCSSLLLIFSCRNKEDEIELVVPETIIPGSETDDETSSIDNTVVFTDTIEESVQILIDRDYRVYDIRNANLDNDEYVEQIILASPLNEDKDVFRLYIADYSFEKDEYLEILNEDIGTNTLNIANIELDDLTGDHFQEVIINGIDSKDQQVYEIFKLFPGKEDEKMSVKEIFSQAVDGDFEIIKTERGNDYKIENLRSDSFLIEIQKKNPDDDKNLIVEKHKWNEEAGIYEISSSDKVKISSLSNENLTNFYRGTSSDYIDFLEGPWYRIKDLNGNPTHNMNEIFQLIKDDKMLTFYSEDIQESFVWTEKNEPVKYRHALSFSWIRNNLLRSMHSSISIYITSLETIQIKIRGNQRWGGTYTQLTGNLQKALTDTSRENLLLSTMNIKGLYKSNLNTEVIFDSPEYTLKEEDKETRGIYTIFDIGQDRILEMKELSENGLTKAIRTYKMEYNETSDDLRIIRTITLQEGELRSRGIVPQSNSELHFEQIEKINQELTGSQ